MILESVEHGPLIWPMIEENGVTRTKKYVELSATEKIQADCDLKATNIILQGLPSVIYSLVNHHRVAKDLWERIQLLMQDLHTTNFDQLHAYLEQHELHANAVRLMRERNQDPLALFSGEMQENDKKQGKKGLKCSILINRGRIQAIPTSLPPQPIGEAAKASNLRRIPPGV
ncbi:hypothetical protein Tco_1441523 [Tanacetum coccineum]